MKIEARAQSYRDGLDAEHDAALEADDNLDDLRNGFIDEQQAEIAEQMALSNLPGAAPFKSRVHPGRPTHVSEELIAWCESADGRGTDYWLSRLLGQSTAADLIASYAEHYAQVEWQKFCAAQVDAQGDDE